jgi:hypothetical protein
MNQNYSSKDRKPTRRSIFIGLRIFIALAVITATVLIIFTATRETWKSLLKVNPLYLPGIIGLLVLYIIFESMRIRLITHAITCKWIPLGYALQVIFCGAFLSAVTPFQAGGFPLQIYVLTKAGLRVGNASLVLLLRALFYASGLIILLPVLFPYFLAKYEGKSMQILSNYAIFAYLFIFGLLILILFYPKPLKKIFYTITFRKGKRTRWTKFLFGIFREIHRMRMGFFDFVKHRKLYSLLIIIVTFIVYIPNYSIAPLIFHGLDVNVSYFEAMIRQIFLLFSAFFFPTPGAEGIIEGGFTALFFTTIPKHLIGVSAILWRFFTYHLVVIIGGFLTLKILHLEEIVQSTQPSSSTHPSS